MLNVFLPHTTKTHNIFLLIKRVTENKKLNEARVIKRPPKESLSYYSIVKHKITTPSKDNTDGNITCFISLHNILIYAPTKKYIQLTHCKPSINTEIEKQTITEHTSVFTLHNRNRGKENKI